MYVDTSCLAAYYLPEERSEDVQKKIKDSDMIAISYLTEIELLSAIKKKQRMGDLSVEDGNLTWNLFKKHRNSGLFEIAELSTRVFKNSEMLMETTSNALRSLDAIHLGIAHTFGFDLYTFDQTLISTAKEFNINTV